MPRRGVRRTARKPSMSGRKRRNATQEFLLRPMLRAPKRIKASRYIGAAMKAGLMPCTQKYAASLLDPSSDASRGACVPSGFPIPSQKARSFIRGTMSTGTAGNGYILWSPTLVNDANNVIYTSAANTAALGDALTNASYTASNVTGQQTKLPYTTAQLASGTVQGRIVSGCIRVRYAGPEDSRSGIITMLEDPDHLALNGYTPAQIASFEGANRERPNGDGAWSQVNWSGPSKEAEVEYVQTPQQNNAVNCIAILVNSTVNNAGALGAAAFEFEAWVNVEYIGRDVQGKTDNQNDQSGMDRILSAAKAVAGTAQQSLNPSATQTVMGKVFAAKPGGTMVGNALQSAASAIHPALGAVWGFGRGLFNRSFAGPTSFSASERGSVAGVKRLRY